MNFRIAVQLSAIWALLCVAPLGAQPISSARGPESLDAGLARRALAKQFSSVAATLEGGKSGVDLLSASTSIREAEGSAVRQMLDSRFEEYRTSVEGFRSAVSALLDRPESEELLFRTLMGGHQACWRLESFIRMCETYGVSSAALVTVLSSSEACARFRDAAFDPRVERIVSLALEAREARVRENRQLREELHALERLLEDIRRLDADR